MFLNTHKVIGILGGMGPEATVDLYNQIIKITPSTKDQDHIPTLIYSNPKIPDRTRNLLSANKDELEMIVQYLQSGARILENGGADLIVMPCNTAHKFSEDIQKAVSIPFFDMIRETVAYIVDKNPDLRKVGLLATNGTIASRLYQDHCDKNTIETVVPGKDIQDDYVMQAIYNIKSGEHTGDAKTLLLKAVHFLEKRGCKAIIMGCTEIPLALNDSYTTGNLINPTKIIAEIAVRESLNSH